MPAKSELNDRIALFGHDSTSGIVAVDSVRGFEGSPNARVRLHFQHSGARRQEEAPVYPFFFLSDVTLLKDFPRNRYRTSTLGGKNYYRNLIVFDSWNSYWDAVRHIQEVSNSSRKRPEQAYLIPSPAQQYLMQSGRTLFKGMGFEDIHRLQLDIETLSEGAFSSPARQNDRIIIIALSDNRGWIRLIDGREMDEKTMLEECISVIREKDPDVIEGHNILGFDLPYILARCEQHGVTFSIGRDGSSPRTFASSMRFAERVVDFPGVEVAGRHIIDTYLQVMSFDVFKRDMPGYSLKAAARYFGFAAEDRTYVDGADICRVWQNDPERLLAYARDDVIETERLARHLSGSTFYLTQMLPMTYGQVSRSGPAAKIEALIVREYLRQRHALPQSESGTQAMGGYTDIFVTGVIGPIIYADVESLYPSIMLNFDIMPETDELDVFQQLLRKLTELRMQTKRSLKTASPTERGELDARQNSYKVLINSFYGQLGFSQALFNDFSEADRVAATGQDILRMMIEVIQRQGGQVIEVDTDGVLFVPPKTARDEAAENAFIDRINQEMPSGIRIGLDGRYRKMLSYKKKNYVLLDYDGNLKFKGSSLISRSNERFGRRFVREATALILEADVDGLHNLYLRTRDKILSHDWSVEDFARTETLKETAEQYESDVANGKRARSAAYELAIERQKDSGQPVRKGDRITFYVAGAGANLAAFENARMARDWNPARPDENTAYYLRRLDEFAAKFEPFFREHDFRLIFSPEDLFGFSAKGIEIIQTSRSPINIEVSRNT